MELAFFKSTVKINPSGRNRPVPTKHNNKALQVLIIYIHLFSLIVISTRKLLRYIGLCLLICIAHI